MAKSFHELSQRSQTVVFLLLCVLTVGAAWQVILSPQQAELAALRQQLGTLETDLVRAQGVADWPPHA